ncbi:MAG: acylphosphatase [Methanotrichaceae archaeon]|nr:acylphosphatase [Methanotrichaceae archaeon]
MMKSVELIIKGRKVQDVGYRPFLLLNALNRGIQNFFAYNSGAKGNETVVVQMQGEDDIIASYIEFVRSQYPVHAEVEEIVEKDFKGQVQDAYKFVQLLQFEQIAKAVPVIISIDKKQDIMIEKQDIMIEKQDIMIEKQDIMIEKQDASIGILREVKEDTCSIRDDISALRKDTSESLSEKYEELRREIAEIKETIMELKAKAA